MTTRRGTYSCVEDIFIELADLLEPPERVTVTEAAERYVRLNNPGAYIGPYLKSMAPYMEEPCNVLNSRDYTGCVFVGPAQSGKTESLILNWLAYSIVVDPADMSIYNPTQSAARDFSMRRIDRMHRNSPEIGSLIAKQRDSDNKFDKHYKSGMLLNMSWPTVTEFAGRPIPRIAMTDYDRMPDDVDGDGSPYDLGSKRTTTFRSFGMTLAESSPSRPIEDLKWIRKSPHQAPPCLGILGLYNRGDRRRWYWPCPECGSYFEGSFSMLEWDTRPSFKESAETVRMVCPVCAYKIKPRQRQEMNEWGMWLKDGQSIDANGRIGGEESRADIASFWMNGTAAAFTTWINLVNTHLVVEDEYSRTLSEDGLKKFYNTDLGVPYVPKSADAERLPEVLKARAEDFPTEEPTEPEEIERRAPVVPLVPANVRFLIATVDVQKNAFVVQVAGISPGMPFDICLIDRFAIFKSDRLDAQGDKNWVKPASYLEDWDKVQELVMNRTYKLSDGSGRKMQIKLTGCDSGGREGVTTNAYNFYRRLRVAGKSGRFQLVKGGTTPSMPRAQINFPDSSRRDKFAVAKGDVPVLMLNSNLLKDSLVARLESVIVGKGRFSYPKWLPDFWYSEMCAEHRTDKGWESPNRTRNEAFDLSYYAIGLCVSELVQAEKLDWAHPPGWAAPWATNDLISLPNQVTRFTSSEDEVVDFASLASKLS